MWVGIPPFTCYRRIQKLASWHLDCSYIILLYSIDGCGDRVEVSKCVSVSGFLNSAYGGVAGRPNRCLWRQQFSKGAKQEYINLLSINPARPPTSNLPPSIQSPTSTFKLEPMRTARFRNQQPLSQSQNDYMRYTVRAREPRKGTANMWCSWLWGDSSS